MSKYQRAFESIERVVVFNKNYYDYINDLKVIKELVDKETPMKPIVEIYRGREVIGCGVCGEVAMDEYCPNCGKK